MLTVVVCDTLQLTRSRVGIFQIIWTFISNMTTDAILDLSKKLSSSQKHCSSCPLEYMELSEPVSFP